MTPFPWSDAMKFGFGILRLSSHDFWAMTPLELAAACKALNPVNAKRMDRKTMENLMTRFPDRRPSHE